MGTGCSLGGGGQTSLKLMDGRSLAPVLHSCRDVTFGLTLASSWRTGLELISGPFRDPVGTHFCSISERGFGTHFGADLERRKYPGK